MTRRDRKPLLMLITSGMREYREYLLKSISTQYRVHLITGTEPTWEVPYLAGATVVSNTGVEPVREAASRVAAEHPVGGVMSWHEEHIVQSAAVAEDLGLPGSAVETVMRCRDKFETRIALATKDLPQPAFRLVGSLEEAVAAAEALGYPVVLKPRAAGGSQGVVLVETAGQLAEQFPFTRDVFVPHAPAFDQVVLIEEYVDGPEISVDSVVCGGHVTPVFVARKQIGFPPYFEETGHEVSACDSLLSDCEFLRVMADVHAALGYTDGWTHSEVKLTPNGPKLIEVNGRLGGDLIPYLGMRATGIDPGLAAAAVACGEEPAISVSETLAAGVRFFYPPWNDTVIESVVFDRTDLPDEIDLLVPLIGDGTVVSPPRKGFIDSRIALATAVARSAPSCRSALHRAQAGLRVRIGGHPSAFDGWQHHFWPSPPPAQARADEVSGPGG